MENLVYKILTEEQWKTASETGLIEVELDKKDGFIHLSTASQLAGTLSFYFADDEDLILLQLDRSQIKDALIYEAPFPVGDRTGEFPHLYSELSVDQVAQVWKMKGTKEELLEDFEAYDEETTSLINSCKEVYKWGIYVRPALQTMCSNNITLLGDAAHPMVPFLGQGGCMAIEDSYTFGVLAGKLKNDFKKIQSVYEKVRLKRNNKIQSTSMMQGKLNHIKNPIGIFIRNLVMKHTSVMSKRTKKIWEYDANKELERLL